MLLQAPEVYAKMSPFMNADKCKRPILLVHGEEDNNPGTFPLQSERFFAVRGQEQRTLAAQMEPVVCGAGCLGA